MNRTLILGEGTKMMCFYGHLAAAYGTMWFYLFVDAIVTQKSINAGPFGAWGFLVIAFCYALIRSSGAHSQAEELKSLRERVRRLEDQLANRTSE